MQQEIRALEVCEELMSEADAFACAFDQPGHVGHRELPRRVGCVDCSEDRRECGERILRDLRPRIRDPREQ